MKTVLTFIILSFSLSAYCQNITFLDIAFKTALIGAGVDTNNDQEISQAEAAAITTIDLRSKNITDLTGINYFINLTNLNIGFNSLTKLDISLLKKLRTLSASDNQLSTVDFSNNLSVQVIELQDNGLTCIDLSQLGNLTQVVINNNPIAGIIDVSKSKNLTEFQSGSCPNLTKICIYSVAATTVNYGQFVKSDATVWSQDCKANEGMVCSKITTAITDAFIQGQFEVYPSLFSETFNLKIDQLGNFDLVIIDITGNILSTETVHGNGIYSLGKGLKTGMYIIKISGMDIFKTFKVQKI
jgi:Leucine-rich repeat (LRR) protein